MGRIAVVEVMNTGLNLTLSPSLQQAEATIASQNCELATVLWFDSGGMIIRCMTLKFLPFRQVIGPQQQ